jgi:hypothetical protein
MRQWRFILPTMTFVEFTKPSELRQQWKRESQIMSGLCGSCLRNELWMLTEIERIVRGI